MYKKFKNSLFYILNFIYFQQYFLNKSKNEERRNLPFILKIQQQFQTFYLFKNSTTDNTFFSIEKKKWQENTKKKEEECYEITIRSMFKNQQKCKDV